MSLTKLNALRLGYRRIVQVRCLDWTIVFISDLKGGNKFHWSSRMDTSFERRNELK